MNDKISDEENREELEHTEALLLESVRNGHLEIVGVDEDGGLTFRLTDEGRKYVENMIGGGTSHVQ